MRGMVPFVVAGFAACANAQMLGHDLTAEWRYPDFNSSIESHTFTVDAGIELTEADILNDDKFAIDVDDATVSFVFNAASNWSITGFNGWYFEDANGTLPQIIGYALDSYSGSGSLVIDAGWNDDAFWANFGGTTVNAGDVLTMRVTFIPAPGAAALLGFGALAASRRRR
ncbi:MAG TPA: hypothetical protein VFF69_06840 [Phycisphaerales bacterium]|nr:hypothetical protein [Phycisphaerales bacterium]